MIFVRARHVARVLDSPQHPLRVSFPISTSYQLSAIKRRCKGRGYTSSRNMSYTVTRKTAESEISVKLGFGPRLPEPKKALKTPMPFFNHMLEQLFWRGGFNLEVSAVLNDFSLLHVIYEDVGTTLGRAMLAAVEARRDSGLRGYGFAYATIDEALARAVLSFEGRASYHFSSAGLAVPVQTENTNSEDLHTFFEGFVQGASCTLHMDMLKGVNGHHIWEALFRACGEALRNALEPLEQRRGMTAGVAGPVEWKVAVDNEQLTGTVDKGQLKEG